MSTVRIPTYAADGRRLRDLSMAVIERLSSLSLAVVRRNRKGTITRAHLRTAEGGHPLLASAHLGQSYSYLASSGVLHWWQFRDFLTVHDRRHMTAKEIAEFERYLQRVFRAVPLSCMGEAVDEIEPTPPAVAASRPVEFDSEYSARPKVVSIDSRIVHKPKRSTPVVAVKRIAA